MSKMIHHLTANERDQIGRTLLQGARLISGVEETLAHRYLEFNYSNYLNGRWRQGQRWVSRIHKVALPFHEACKALFCPICSICGQHASLDECSSGKDHLICWNPVGFAPVRMEAGGEGEEAIRTCSLHGPQPWRRCMQYSTVALFTGNKAAKTSMTIAEFVSWSFGYRPWDNTLTAPQGRGRVWMIVCQTIGTSGRETIRPLVERYCGKRVRPIVNSSKIIAGWTVVDGPSAGDVIRLVSHDQHKNTKAAVSPLAGINPAGVMWDEPTESEIRTEVTRGLVPAMAEMNWGRELMASTLIDGAPQARAYMRNEVWDVAGNRGGAAREIFALGGSIYDNPALTRETIRQIVAKWAPWERAARISGIEGVDRGRLLPDFGIETHVYDDMARDYLTDLQTGEPSDYPIVLSVDPHLVRPWVMTWLMLQPYRDAVIWRVVREWPKRLFKELRHYRNAEDNFAGNFEAYAKIIEREEAEIPGGRNRVLWRIMDPAAGNTEVGGAGRTFAQAMSAYGYRFRTEGVPRDLEGGHHDLRKLMRGTWTPGMPVTETEFPFFMIARSCQNSIWAVMNYVNDDHPDHEKSREKPAETGKDQIDTWRWPISMRLKPRSWLHPTDPVCIMASTSNNGLG